MTRTLPDRHFLSHWGVLPCLLYCRGSHVFRGDPVSGKTVKVAPPGGCGSRRGANGDHSGGVLSLAIIINGCRSLRFIMTARITHRFWGNDGGWP